jgi:hypothetical protein
MALAGHSIQPTLGFALLIDIPALAVEAGGSGWARLNSALAALVAPDGMTASVLTYGGKTDITMLHRSYPALTVFGQGAGGKTNKGAKEEHAEGSETQGAPAMPPAKVVKAHGPGLHAVDLIDLVKASGGRLPAMAGEEEGKVMTGDPAVGGLTQLCARLLGRPIEKVWQTSLWHRRPLLSQQRHYAALDAWVLPQLLAKIRQAVITE